MTKKTRNAAVMTKFERNEYDGRRGEEARRERNNGDQNGSLDTCFMRSRKALSTCLLKQSDLFQIGPTSLFTLCLLNDIFTAQTFHQTSRLLF